MINAFKNKKQKKGETFHIKDRFHLMKTKERKIKKKYLRNVNSLQDF